MSSLKFEVWVYVVWLDFWKENFVTHSEVGLFFVEGIFSFVPKENNDDVCDVVNILYIVQGGLGVPLFSLLCLV